MRYFWLQKINRLGGCFLLLFILSWHLVTVRVRAALQLLPKVLIQFRLFKGHWEEAETQTWETHDYIVFEDSRAAIVHLNKSCRFVLKKNLF